ncbi:TraM recognition domain-containing protein [Paraflavisolibacter sp. H34]|uniref:TraM recognition domain-containing protein n=1 Tax=Huijunlia imazamoxiresistens TaxID=3127457 RepID=UPI0030198D72
MQSSNGKSDPFLTYLGIFVLLGFCLAEIAHYNAYFLRPQQFSNHLLNKIRDSVLGSRFLRESGTWLRLGYIVMIFLYVWAERVLVVKEQKTSLPYISVAVSLLILLLVKHPYLTVTRPWQLAAVDVLYFFALFALPFSLLDIKAQRMQLGGFTFRQNKSLIENFLSINWKTRDGYVNVLEPQRGISIVGGPGSGKTYTLVEEVIRQLLSKGVTAMIYDFKYPALARYAYSVMCRWGWRADLEQSYPWATGKGRMFYYINFTDVRYSHRCNPLDPRILNNIALAGECATTILCNLNREWIKKRGFFEDSAIVLLTAILWFNKKYADRTGRNISTLPHAIAFATMSEEYTIPILMDDPELRASAAAVASAVTKGAHEQYAGVIATLQNSIGKLNVPEMFYVMTEDPAEKQLAREERISFTLDLNNPQEPKVVVLGNDNNLSETLAPALSLYAAMIAKTINQQGKLPCLYCVDEAPTIYIPRLDNLPNTGRSNGVITVLAAQDFGQYDRDYGKDEARVIKAGLGNIFIGEVGDGETARYAASLFGKRNMRKVSTTISANDISRNYSQSLEELFPPDAIMALNKGEFVGKVTAAPDKANKSRGEDVKLFNSKFEIQKESDPACKSFDGAFLQELPPVLDISPEEMKAQLRENQARIYAEMEEVVRSELIVVTAKNVWRSINEGHYREQERAGAVVPFIEQHLPQLLAQLQSERALFKTEVEAIKAVTKKFLEPVLRLNQPRLLN